MTNRLASSTSPYLQQHRDNPVHWQEWGPDAFAEARERDVPVLDLGRVRRLPLVPCRCQPAWKLADRRSRRSAPCRGVMRRDLVSATFRDVHAALRD